MSHRGFPITKTIRERRRKEGQARQAEYNKLTIQQKLDRLPVGEAKKQRARLEAALEAQKNKKPANDKKP